uniref:Uncharacterized protein n=1 Tax=Anguilla anguilla TaxID=7936 RepID=A0A0E9UZU1_ANGAN
MDTLSDTLTHIQTSDGYPHYVRIMLIVQTII